MSYATGDDVMREAYSNPVDYISDPDDEGQGETSAWIAANAVPTWQRALERLRRPEEAFDAWPFVSRLDRAEASARLVRLLFWTGLGAFLMTRQSPLMRVLAFAIPLGFAAMYFVPVQAQTTLAVDPALFDDEPAR